MNKATPRKFLEHLKNPSMAEVRQNLLEIIDNPDNLIESVSSSDYGQDYVTMTIKIRVPDGK